MMRHLLLALLLPACSSSGTNAVTTTSDAANGEASSYPAGPYGLKEGDVFESATLRGYMADPSHVDVTALPIVDTSLAQIREQHPECKCMLIAVAGLWCTPAMKDQTDVLPTLLSKPSRCIVSIVAESTTPGVTANDADLTAVGKKTKPPFPLVLAKDLSPRIMKAMASLPVNFVLRTETMQIVTEGTESTPTTLFDVCESAK